MTQTTPDLPTATEILIRDPLMADLEKSLFVPGVPPEKLNSCDLDVNSLQVIAVNVSER